jgi:excisionase family DNA binding protein
LPARLSRSVVLAKAEPASVRARISATPGATRANDEFLLTVDEAADLLRTTRRAIYAMVERRHLPGVIRIRRRVLLRADDLLHWLDQKRAPSPEE